jgi:hypothetical protein
VVLAPSDGDGGSSVDVVSDGEGDGSPVDIESEGDGDGSVVVDESDGDGVMSDTAQRWSGTVAVGIVRSSHKGLE